jgi:hypothetical protein
VNHSALVVLHKLSPVCFVALRLVSQRLWSELGVSPSVELAAMMDCTLLGATQTATQGKDGIHAPQLKENRFCALAWREAYAPSLRPVCSATLHVLCLIRSKLYDLKRQRKERLTELLQVPITPTWHKPTVFRTMTPFVVRF